MNRESETLFEVIGYDDDWNVIGESREFDDWYYAEEEAEEMAETEKYAHIIIRRTESYEFIQEIA